MNQTREKCRRPGLAACTGLSGLLLALGLSPHPAAANNYGESSAWQFQTTADKANKAMIEDMRLRKKGGYYDSFQNIYNTTNTTNIGKQVNCNVSASAVGNSGSNGMTSTVSSPTNTGSTSADATGNDSTNGYSQGGLSGVVLGPDGLPVPGSAIDNNQSNSGNLDAGVNGSSTNVGTGPINASGGTSDQVINSDQGNNGSQSASINGSTACSLAAAGPLN